MANPDPFVPGVLSSSRQAGRSVENRSWPDIDKTSVRARSRGFETFPFLRSKTASSIRGPAIPASASTRTGIHKELVKHPHEKDEAVLRVACLARSLRETIALSRRSVTVAGQ
jgi:hypothetical protein